MTTHEDLRNLIVQLQAAAVRFEKNAHLGQPIRSDHMYRYAIDQLDAATGPLGSHEPSRYGFSDARQRALFRSKNNLIDRTHAATILRATIEDINDHIARAKASRP